MDSDGLARFQFDASNAALIGRIWDSSGAQTLALSLFNRNGAITPLVPAASIALGDSDFLQSPIVVDGHSVLLVRADLEVAQYIRLDLTNGKVTVLLTAKYLAQELPSGALGGEPHPVDMEPLGTTRDGSVARVMVRHATFNGAAIGGQAYFEIDLRTLRVTGPHALPNVGPIAISADGRYIAWSELRVVSGNGIRDLHIRDLATGHETTIGRMPFSNEAAHGGVRFSPDDSYVSLEGYGEQGMGIAVYDLGGRRLTLITSARPNVEPLDNVPSWWTDEHTIVYQTTDLARTTRTGHRLDVTTGSVVDYPAELGGPVLMLAG
jgi:hypothetical protein